MIEILPVIHIVHVEAKKMHNIHTSDKYIVVTDSLNSSTLITPHSTLNKPSSSAVNITYRML